MNSGVKITVLLTIVSRALAAGAGEPAAVGRAVAILQAKCAGCHGGDPDDVRAELDVRSRAGMLEGGWSEEPALVPGRPDKSLIYLAITWKNDDLEMPPKQSDRLTADEMELVRRWIAAGAPWPRREVKQTNRAGDRSAEDPIDGVVIRTSGGLSPDWKNRTYKLEDVWAYRPIRRYAVPAAVDRPGDAVHPVDAFVRRRLSENDLRPAPRADKRTLIRRAAFGLTGLPPTPDEIDAFLADDSTKAFGRLIQRLLASPHYGQQMAQHWLDVVRYADTGGFANDFERPNAWRYRDYVVRSFNQDKPYDRFVTEQLAGDELDPSEPENLIAVGYLRMGPWEHTGMSVAAVTRQQFLDDVTHSVGVTFLAQGLRCAKCHDHKFDPVPTEDYYRMQAVFAPVQFADRTVPYQKWENVSQFDRMKARTRRLLDESKAYIADVRRKHQEAVAAYLKKRGVERAEELPADERPRGGFYGLSELEMSLEKIHRKRIAYYEREMKRYEPFAFSVYNGPTTTFSSHQAVNQMPPPEKRTGPVEEVHVLQGGALESPGQKVSPGVLSAVAGSNDTVQPTAWNSMPYRVEGRRLALARWIAHPDNTLTARVIVNRVWQMHFGRGLVATSNNFGKMGSRPTHPELLDWLATWFVQHDWSIKRLHQLLLTSATYQQTDNHPGMENVLQRDPTNQLLAYFPPRRLAAEEIRDSMLAVAGQLNPQMGGPGVFPEINWEVALQPRHIMGSVAPAYQPSPNPSDRHRRTLYAFRYRTLADPMLEVFNRPGSDTSCERRDQTTVTPQVFALMNGQFVHDRALALARRLEESRDESADRIDYAFQLVYGRPSTDHQRRLCLDHLAAVTSHHRASRPEPVSLPTTIQRQMVEELTGRPFQWEEQLDVMTDYQPDLKPWDAQPETRALAEVCLVLFNSNEFLYVR